MPIAEASPEYLAKSDDWATKLAEASVKSQADYEILKEVQKDFLAGLMNNIDQGAGGGTSEIKLERMARASTEWQEFRKGYFVSVEKYLRDKVRARNAERHHETARSMLSYRKEEMGRISG